MSDPYRTELDELAEYLWRGIELWEGRDPDTQCPPPETDEGHAFYGFAQDIMQGMWSNNVEFVEKAELTELRRKIELLEVFVGEWDAVNAAGTLTCYQRQGGKHWNNVKPRSKYGSLLSATHRSRAALDWLSEGGEG